MNYSNDDLFISKLVAYREAANQGQSGQQAVLCVLRNRMLKNKSSFFIEATKVWQFSSISIDSFGGETLTSNVVTEAEVIRLKKKVNNGNQFIKILSKFPVTALDISLWNNLDVLAKSVLSGEAEDITNGATLYYAKYIAPPAWATNGKAVTTCTIEDHIFFKEL